MASERVPPPGVYPRQVIGDWVGPDEAREDVTHLSDREINVKAYDVALKTWEAVRAIKLGVRIELDDMHVEIGGIKHRLTVLEGGVPGMGGNASSLRPPKPRPSASRFDAPRDEDAEPEEPSIHEWNEILAAAGKNLSKTVKDPRTRFDSDRARAIAIEAVEKINAETKQAAELNTWRRIKGLGPVIGKAALKAIVPAIVGGAAIEIAHLLHLLGLR